MANGDLFRQDEKAVRRAKDLDSYMEMPINPKES